MLKVNHSFKDSYSGKRVLVTGHTGFKGSWLSLWLKELGAEVIGYSLDPPSEPNNFTVCALQNMLIHHYGDVRDVRHLESVFEEHRPEIVFHLAAQPLVRLSYLEPRLTYETNVMGAVNLLEAVRKTDSVRVVIIITSDKCYENREWVWGYRENDPLGGFDPYSSSKGCAELVTSAYLKSFFPPEKYPDHGVALATARAGNVIGGGDWGQDRLIPDSVRALSQNEIIVIRNPMATRPWQHVLEPLGGYLLLGVLMQQDVSHYTGAWNFGPSDNEMFPVEKVVEKCINLWGCGSYSIQSMQEPDNSPSKINLFHEANRLKLDCSKAHALLCWKPVYSFDESIEKTVLWYKKFYSGASADSMLNHTVQQIKGYMHTSGF